MVVLLAIASQSQLAPQLRQLRHVGRNPSRLIFSDGFYLAALLSAFE
jgi:hypothetical protein